MWLKFHWGVEFPLFPPSLPLISSYFPSLLPSVYRRPGSGFPCRCPPKWHLWLRWGQRRTRAGGRPGKVSHRRVQVSQHHSQSSPLTPQSVITINTTVTTIITHISLPLYPHKPNSNLYRPILIFLLISLSLPPPPLTLTPCCLLLQVGESWGSWVLRQVHCWRQGLPRPRVQRCACRLWCQRYRGTSWSRRGWGWGLKRGHKTRTRMRE